MKIAYFDCFAGVSGDMILGALIDAGLGRKELESELAKLKVKDFKIRVKKVIKGNITAAKVTVDIKQKRRLSKLKDIIQLIDRSKLNNGVKVLSKRAFEELAKVEAKIHGQRKEEVHFHEVGALDSVVDIVGAFIGLKKLGIDAVYASPLHLGRGFIQCAHGTLPVPAPATAALLKGIPIYSHGLDAELVTPSGAAILKCCAKNFGPMPRMRISAIGYGAGDKKLPIPNLLRLFLGETDVAGGYIQEDVVLLETNIDDMAPEVFTYCFEQLTKQGALDVYMTPIYMKKNRIGTQLSVLTTEDELERTLATIFTETTTLGIRVRQVQRYKLARKVISVQTKYGKVKVKLARLGEKVKNIAPEYESCERIANQRGVPFKDVYDEAKKCALDCFFVIK